MAPRTLRKALGLVICLTVLLAGSGAAYAAGPGGGSVRADGKRVAPAAAPVQQDHGNDNASVVGVPYCANIYVSADCWTWINTTSGTPCPTGHFCLYTNVLAAEGGKVFSLFHCRRGGADWALRAWNGTGLYDNSNTGGAHAFIKGIAHNVLVNVPPGTDGTYDFRPAYYVQAC
ncbi:hypothetical protein GCM10023088_25470 [Actinomadura verrucosospora]|uniref:hypothetical protein n=1 Tax=Actinomadura verrucosospora TaxID=46165 RepID=UPI0031E9C369